MNMLFLNQMALSVRPDGTYAPFSADAWKFAGQMTLLGMTMVFAVLAILWAVLAIFKRIFAGKTPKAPKATKPAASKADGAIPDEITAVLAATVQAIQADEAAQTVAVITAAVAAYRAEEGCTGEFRVVSFKRASGARGWNARR